MIPELAPAPILNLFAHWAVFLLAFFTFIAATVVWYRRKKQGQLIEVAWKMFVFGLFFYTVSEVSDLLTPGLRASLGMHNYFTEFALLVGLTFIFIALRNMILSSRAGAEGQQQQN